MTESVTYRCEDCSGNGETSADRPVGQIGWQCNTCNGAGRVPDRRKHDRREGERRKG